jgi:tRNA (cytidine/uridine-2'-O-)-methyltransferase
LALFQPDIPQNTGTLLRMAMCLAISIDIIKPCGFIFTDRRLKRAGMNYLNDADVTHHDSWEAFREFVAEEERRLVLLSTKAQTIYTDFSYTENDILMVGRESAGVPDHVFNAVDRRVRISMSKNARSLNVAIAAAIVLGEGLRQLKGPSAL